MKKQHAQDTRTVAQAADTAKLLAKAGSEIVALGVLTAAEVVVGAAESAGAKIALSEKDKGHAQRLVRNSCLATGALAGSRHRKADARRAPGEPGRRKQLR